MDRPLRVLIVEDNPADAELILLELRRAGFAPVWERVDQEADYAAKLGEDFEVILSDYAMPRFSGVRALTMLTASGLDIPFLLISGTIGEETAVEMMKNGAADYLFKDRLTRLGPAITQALERSRLRQERRRAEAALRAQAEMLDLAHDAIIVSSLPEHKITFWNKGAEALYGWTSVEALGSEITHLVQLDPACLARLREQLPRTGRWRQQNEQVTQAGRTVIVMTSATLIHDAKGQPKSVLIINTDLTEQKELEARFLRAQRMESIGNLAAGVAHDLNNILAPILMYAPMLAGELPPEQRRQMAEAIEMSAQRGADIVKQVLAFGRGLGSTRGPLRLGPLVKDLLKVFAETFPKAVRIENSVPEELWPITGDPTQMHQVLLNLCVNARDAMPEGGTLRLHGRVAEVDASYASMIPGATPGRYVVLEVGDTGSGIPPEIIARIFEPFFTTKPLGSGTGLGLSTVRDIVKNHGGFLTVESVVGHGTRFLAYLPAAETADGAADKACSAKDLPRGRGELVLLVEDEAAVGIAAQTVLESHGYRVLRACDGAEALALYAQHSEQICAVFTDFCMPFMDGLGLIRALRRLESRAPILVATGQGENGRACEFRALEVAGILHKPYSAEALLRLLHTALAPAPAPH